MLYALIAIGIGILGIFFGKFMKKFAAKSEEIANERKRKKEEQKGM